MKAIKIIFLLTFFFNYAKGQIAYYDALKIKSDIELEISDTKRIKLDVDPTQVQLLISVLKNYIDADKLKQGTSDSLLLKILNDEFKVNPFLFLNNATQQSGTKIPEFAANKSFSFSSISSKVSGLPVTNFADGIAKFLVKRFKQELTITFFQKFKDEMSKVEELKTLFPETFKVLLVIDKDIYKFSTYLNTLRESFIKDLGNLYTDVKKLAKLDKYQKYLDRHKEFKTILLNAFFIIDQFAKGVHPGEAIAKFDVKSLEFTDQTVQHNTQSSVSLLKEISGSFKSLSNDHYWVPADSVKMFFENDTTRNIYFGLLCQKCASISFQRGDSTMRVDTLLSRAKEKAFELSDSLKEYKVFIEEFIDHAQEVGDNLSDLKEKKKNEIDYNDYYKLYNASLDLVDHSFKFIDLPYVKLNDSVEENMRLQSGKWIYVARNTGELFIDVRTKNYSSAILNLTCVLDTVLKGFNANEVVDGLQLKLDQLHDSLDSIKTRLHIAKSNKRNINRAISKFSKDKNSSYSDLANWLGGKNVTDTSILHHVDLIVQVLKEKDVLNNHPKLKGILLKYGGFGAAMAQAKNSDDVEAAIESVALPVGSASIKKNSAFNIALNGYLGGFFGNEYLKQTPGRQWAPLTGVYAPIGITISKPVKFIFKKKGSISAFVSAIDLGAFASFRLNDDSTKALPEVTLKNIFAPGVGVIYGIPGWPLSLGWSWQYGPTLREINGKEISASDRPNHRWQFFLAVDIPILNFYTRSKD